MRNDTSGNYWVDLSQRFRVELLEAVIPFWEQYSLDREYGGYFTCLDRQGKIYDRDKFMWLQARQVWMFSTLYQEVEARSNWIEIARHGMRFIESFGADEHGSYYFSLDRTGHPLTHAHSIFSDCFVATAYHRFGAISAIKRYHELARLTYQRYFARMDDPKGHFTKTTGYRDYDNYAILMMWAYLAWQMQDLFTADERETIWRQCLQAMLIRFRNPKSGLIHEYCQADGTFPDTFEGRLLNPGHALEGMWFCMDIASALQDRESIEICLLVILQTLEYSWDEAYGGIYYFMDARQFPPQQLEWNHKLWWVHLEALIALIKARQLQPENEQYAQWFNRVLEYTWTHFRDPEHGGEWFGYLDRQGQVQLDLKGGKWKGCFHLPRALLILSQVAEQMAADGV